MLKELKKIMPALIVTASTGLLLSVAVEADAAAGVCSNCHVMHASEAGTASTANDTLLRSTCIGCHTQDNGTGTSLANDEPGVLTDASAASSTNTLAGGNFEYANTDETYGHNPSELGSSDSRYGTSNPPGYKSGFTLAPASDNDAVGSTWTNAGNVLTCAGIYGCHGKHTADALDGAHHANVSNNTGLDGSTVGKSYRFLYGITGWEDADYELNVTNANGDHNVYHAEARAADTVNLKTTISYSCAECHGIFHSGETGEEGVSTDSSAFSSPWIRHPVDVEMPTGATEYAGYSAYNVNVPVGSSDVSDGSLTVGNAADRIVMCLSCHRAHASPYPAALRWDYTTMVAGGGTLTTGCFACHTTKDDGS